MAAQSIEIYKDAQLIDYHFDRIHLAEDCLSTGIALSSGIIFRLSLVEVRFRNNISR